MADWIKVETTSSQKIEVLTMADILDMDEHMVFGKLVILWCWADANTVDGNAKNVTKRMIDRVVCNTGFADAMLDERVKWLVQDENGNISFPNFDRHNGKGAKKRATTARRVKQHRENVTEQNKECNTESVTLPLPEKIREDKKREDSKNSRFTPPTQEEVFLFMQEKGYPYQNEAMKFVNFYGSKGWMVGKNKMKNWKLAVNNWLSNCNLPKQQAQPEYDHEEARQREIEALRRNV